MWEVSVDVGVCLNVVFWGVGVDFCVGAVLGVGVNVGVGGNVCMDVGVGVGCKY